VSVSRLTLECGHYALTDAPRHAGEITVCEVCPFFVDLRDSKRRAIAIRQIVGVDLIPSAIYREEPRAALVQARLDYMAQRPTERDMP
jgi:hypothetical protein